MTTGRERLLALQVDTILAGATLDAMRDRFDRIRGRHENGTAPRAVSAYQLFQTPVNVAERMAALAGIEPGSRVLEPSAGLGRLLDAAAKYSPAEVVAVECDAGLCAELYRQERQRVKLMQRDFLEVTPEETGLFDVVVMNPPFHMRSDIKHVLHARRFLLAGGRLVGLAMATNHREAALRSFCDHWEKLPGGTFAKEGTGVEVYLFRMTLS